MPKKLYHDTNVECWALWFCLPPLATMRMTKKMTNGLSMTNDRTMRNDKGFSFGRRSLLK